MKLSKIYSNLPRYFKPIRFNFGFNVILGHVSMPRDRNRDSHNLGKSLLIDVIDYCLLKRLTNKSFTQKIPPELRRNIEFYLEVLIEDGRFLTLRRRVENNTKISFKESAIRDMNYSSLNDNEWDYFDLPLERAKDFLNGKLALYAIKPFDYRKGVSYFLRNQQDYSDIFQIHKFSRGKHSDWKPYIGKTLGFSSELISDKYKYDKKIDEETKDLQNKKEKMIYPGETLGKLRARRDAEEGRVRSLEESLDQFDLRETELRISKHDLVKLEERISFITNEIYNHSADLHEIEKSLRTKKMFKVADIQLIYDQIGVCFQNVVLKKYEDLEKFNQSITKDRAARLGQQKKDIEGKIKTLEKSLDNANGQRKQALAIVRELDTFNKYKAIQQELVSLKTNLKEIERDIERLEKIGEHELKINEDKRRREEIVSSIKSEIDSENETLGCIRRFFLELAWDVLDRRALLYLEKNNEDNIDFHAYYTLGDTSDSTTSEDQGTSYGKFLCVFFDLAVIRYYMNKGFYRFVYHDGILEALVFHPESFSR